MERELHISLVSSDSFSVCIIYIYVLHVSELKYLSRNPVNKILRRLISADD